MVWDKIQAKYEEIVKILERKAAGPITANVQAGSATSEGLETKPKFGGSPKNKHGQMKDEEEEYPIILEETDFWRD